MKTISIGLLFMVIFLGGCSNSCNTDICQIEKTKRQQMQINKENLQNEKDNGLQRCMNTCNYSLDLESFRLSCYQNVCDM